MKVGDKVVCITPNNYKAKYTERPRFGQVLAISEIKLKANKPWLMFGEISTKIGFNPVGFRLLIDENVESILKEVTQNPILV